MAHYASIRDNTVLDIDNLWFQIVLEGVIDSSRKGEIALDSVYMENAECSESGEPATCQAGEYLCTDGTCVPASVKCDGVIHCEDASDEDWRAGCPG